MTPPLPIDSPFEYFVQHIQLIGWPAVVALAWRAGTFLTRAEDRLLGIEQAITKAITNDLPHIQEGLSGVQHSIDTLNTSINRVIDDIRQIRT